MLSLMTASALQDVQMSFSEDSGQPMIFHAVLPTLCCESEGMHPLHAAFFLYILANVTVINTNAKTYEKHKNSTVNKEPHAAASVCTTVLDHGIGTCTVNCRLLVGSSRMFSL